MARSCGARTGATPGAASPAARPTACMAWPARAPAPAWPWEKGARSCGARTGVAPGAASSDANRPECAITLVTPVQRNDVALITLSRVGPGRVRKEVRDFGVILD